jgi:hypothetical protein
MAGKGDKAELEQLLSSYIDGECPQAERDRVQEGLRHDPEFRALYTQLLRTIKAVGAMPGEAAPGYVRERILSQLERRALLGVASIAPAPPVRPEPSHGHPTAWLSLLAAAMLVAGVGATWWMRMHQEKAPPQLAMAPVPLRDSQIGVGKTAPPEADGRMRGSSGPDRAADEAAAQYGKKIAAPAQAPSSPVGQVSAPAAKPLPSPQVEPSAVVRPEAPVMADRTVHDVARSESPTRPALDHALAMRERDSAPVGGKGEALRSPGRAATEATAAAPIAEAAPLPEAKNVHMAAGVVGDASLLAREGSGAGYAAPAAALAAAPRDQEASDVRVTEAPSQTATLASAGTGQAVAAPTAGVRWNGLARTVPAGFVGAHGNAGQLQKVPGPTVTQLRVNVRDVGQQLAFTGGVIQNRVQGKGGQAVQPSDAPVIVAAVPPESQGLLIELIKQAPGVLHVQSQELSASDPLARQVSFVAAEQQWLQSARQFVEWAGSVHSSGNRFSGSFVPSCEDPQAPRIIPRECTPLMIVLQAVEPAATSQPANP